MWYVYGLQCNDRSLYIGSTNNINRRISEHKSGQNQSTKGKNPLHLKFYIAVLTEKGARSLERYFKTGSGKAVLKKRILIDEATSK